MNMQEFYEQRISQLQEDINLLKHRKRNLGLGRLISFVAAVTLFFGLLEFNGMAAVITAIVLLIIFIFIAIKDLNNTRHLKFKQTLLTINQNELNACRNDFSAFDDGDRFRDQTHPYSNDLDIFGRHSLFQWINRTTAAPAAHLLAARLSSPLEKETVLQVQDAVKELEPEKDWRQQLQAIGMQSKMNEDVYTQIKEWIEREQAENKKMIGSLVIAFPVITLLIIILASFHILPWKILWISFCVHLLLLWRVNKIVTPEYEFLSEAIHAIDSFYGAIQWITQKKFQSSYLQKIQNKCYKEGQAAFQLLDKLKGTLHKMHLRLNPLIHFPLNLCVFWDWYQYRKLTLWRNKYSTDLLEWVKIYAEMEVLSSFANMAFNHPDWCYPEIADQHFMLSAKALGHPLLPDDKRICNDVNFSDTGKIMLVTGSNMAGKSTFLRTVGVNVILAMAGSVACAKEMIVSPVKIISSMRIADNLEENISTFYAELKKLEFILQKVRAHEKVFLLLDEILRGTNSQDRHTGAKALIKQLLHEDAIGILATHDLELTGMGNEYKNQILNYHFDAEVQDQELYFDYKLKPGICTSMNASLLMRKIGIEV